MARGAGELHPALVDLAGPGGVDGNVAVAVAGFGGADVHGLVPAVHAGNGIGMHGKGEVLVDSGVGPPDPGGVGVLGVVGPDVTSGVHGPACLAVLQVDRGHHAARADVLMAGELPAAHVMRASDHAGPDTLGDPGLGHEVADLGFHPDEVTGLADTQSPG